MIRLSNDSNYELRIVSDGKLAMSGELFFVEVRGVAQRFYSEIGKVSGHFNDGDADEFRSHWKICLMLYNEMTNAEQLSHFVIQKLVAANLCKEPIWVQVYQGRLITVLDGYGELTYGD
ncbi:MAG: hypothetical protein QM811_20630 [Pirellulales bacterium]